MRKLINESGRPAFGLQTEPLTDLNIADFKPDGSLKSRKNHPHKRWIFLGVSNKDITFGFAIVHLGYLANLFAYVFDRKLKKLVCSRDVIVPFGMGVIFSGSSASGSVSFKSGGITAGIMITPDAIKLEADLGNGFEISQIYSRLKDSLNLVTRNGLKGFNYTNKEAGLSTSGVIKTNGAGYNMDPAEAAGGFDYTFGVLQRRTFWNWASGGGLDLNGRKLGFNLAMGVNETGFTENVFWVDGRMTKVDTVNFTYNSHNLMAPWKIKSFDGKVDLIFKPEGGRSKNFDIGFIKSYFHQPFGTFSGVLFDGNDACGLKDVYGFAEEHEAVW